MQAADSIRALRAAKAGDTVMYFASDRETGLLMEARSRTDGSGKLSASARDADDIGAVAAGLAQNGFGFLFQKRRGIEPGAFDFNYYIRLTKEVGPADIKNARETYVRPSIDAAA